MHRGPKCQEKKKELGSYRKKEKEKATVRSAPDGSDKDKDNDIDNNLQKNSFCQCAVAASVDSISAYF